MAAPTLHAAGALFAVASGNTITPVIPAGQLNNDVAVMACMTNVGSTFTTPTDWTVVPGSTAVNSANQSTAWFWKRLTGSDGNPSSTTSAAGSTSNGLYGRIYVWRGCVDTGDPFEAVGNAGAPTSSTTPQTSEVITTGVDRLVCSLLLVDDDNVWNSGMPPAGWANMGGRLVSTTGGDCMSDAISQTAPAATTIPAATFGTMSAADYWRSLSFALIPAAGAPITGTAHFDFIFTASAVGALGRVGAAERSRAPIPAILMVSSPAAWNTHPYYKTPVTALNWGRQSDLDLIDSALAAYPDRTRVVLITEDSDISLGNGVAAMNWALRHYDQVHAIALRTPIIDLEERHDRVAGDAPSIEASYGGSGTYLDLDGAQGGNAITPNNAAYGITGDLTLRFELRPDTWQDPAFWRIIGGRWVESGNQRSWRLLIRGLGDDSGAQRGRLQFNWSTNGTDTLSAISTASPESVFGTDIGAIEVALDVVNGANKTVTFRTAPTLDGTYTTLGSPVTTAGNTSVHAGTAPLELGTINNGVETAFFEPYIGSIRKFSLRNSAAAVVANPDFTVQTVGATSFTDSNGRVWTINPTASIKAGYITAMPIWNPGYTHRRDMAAQLLGDRLHIWRDPADTVTPAAVTDALAAAMRATLHTSLGTTDQVVPDGQDWVNQPAWVEMKRVHDYARANAATAGVWKTGDGGRTIVLPDGRWMSHHADSHTGPIDPDDTFGAAVSIIRNAALIHNSAGTITGQHYSSGVGSVAFLPDQIDFPNSFYWPVGGTIDGGNLSMIMLHRESTGPFGTALDIVILTLNASTFAFISRVSLGEPYMEPQNMIADPATGYIYVTFALPISIGRVPIGSLTNITAWEWWDGTTWQPNRANRAELLELVDGQTRPLKINASNNGWDIRRYGGGWLAIVRGWFEPYVGIYHATQPQGPWTRYRYVPTPETGGNRLGAAIYAYTPFWHPERDPAPDRLIFSYNALTLEPVPPNDEWDFLYYDPHFVVCPIYRELFP